MISSIRVSLDNLEKKRRTAWEEFKKKKKRTLRNYVERSMEIGEMEHGDANTGTLEM